VYHPDFDCAELERDVMLADILFYRPSNIGGDLIIFLFLCFFCAVLPFRGWKKALLYSSLFASVLYLAPMFICAGIFFPMAVMAMKDTLLAEEKGFTGIEKRHTVTEYAPDGTIVAYRYFDMLEGNVLASVGKGRLVDGGTYPGGYKRSDRVPTMKNTNGIYAAKTPDSPILEQYKGRGRVLGEVRLSGRVIEGKYGFRAHECQAFRIIK
jgi:hypothetical protein